MGLWVSPKGFIQKESDSWQGGVVVEFHNADPTNTRERKKAFYFWFAYPEFQVSTLNQTKDFASGKSYWWGCGAGAPARRLPTSAFGILIAGVNHHLFSNARSGLFDLALHVLTTKQGHAFCVAQIAVIQQPEPEFMLLFRFVKSRQIRIAVSQKAGQSWRKLAFSAAIEFPDRPT